MRRLLFRLLQEMEQHHDTVLVCIVEESGSAPRGTGAWMLVNGTGRVAGTIGGGRLELRSIETAMVLLAVVMFFLDIVIPLSCSLIFACFGSCRHQSLDFYQRDRQSTPFIRRGQAPRMTIHAETDS